MPVISRSSGPSTLAAESSSTSCLNCIGMSKFSPLFHRRQWGGNRRLLRHPLGLACDWFRRRQLRCRVRTDAEISRCALCDCFENRAGGLAAVIDLGVRLVEKHAYAKLRIIGG